MSELLPGDPARVGPFRLTSRLGAGGMGVVYVGVDATDRRAAVKVLQRQYLDDPGFVSRFKREAVLLARVEGPCTCRVLAADVEAAPPYIALEYVSGPTLHDQVEERGPLDAVAAESLAIALLEALRSIHDVGVVHRDLKPSNIILAADGPKVVDFGIAHLTDVTASTGLTTAGIVLGSPSWMAPEQLTGGPSGPASDVHAWAATLFYACTGDLPFGDGGMQAIFWRILNTEPDLTRVPPGLRNALRAGLTKDPLARPSLLEALKLLRPSARPDISSVAAQVVGEQWRAVRPPMAVAHGAPTGRTAPLPTAPTAVLGSPAPQSREASGPQQTCRYAEPGAVPGAGPTPPPAAPRRRRRWLLALLLVVAVAAVAATGFFGVRALMTTSSASATQSGVRLPVAHLHRTAAA